MRGARQVANCPGAAVWSFDLQDCPARLLAADVEGESGIANGACLSVAELGFSPEELEGVADLVEEFSGEATPSLLARSLQAEGVRSLSILPLEAGGCVIGCLNLGMSAPGGLPPDDLQFARQVADLLAVALQDARLYDAERHARRNC